MTYAEDTLLGISLPRLSHGQVLSRIETYLGGGVCASIATPNPEMLVESFWYPAFGHILRSVDLRICDGVGMVFMSGGKCIRYPGIDCMLDTLAMAERCGKRVAFFGGTQRVMRELVLRVQHLYPQLTVCASITPGTYALVREKNIYTITAADHHEAHMQELRAARPDIVFVALGHGKQEAWIMEYAKTIPTVRLAFGVGGAFDLIAGARQRAPRCMRRVGLEWLWRLFGEPERLPRIIRAVCVFPALVLFDKTKRMFLS
jgi:N-acetylglucosaminyldiphosphoundecaprenol N-acetyl-beta-D-mannosaminyltransferase